MREGIITAEDSITNIQAQIVDGNNQTLMTHYTIPAWKTWYLVKGIASAESWKSINMKFKVRELWGVFRVTQIFDVFENPYSDYFKVPIPIPEKSDIKVTGVWSVATACSATYELILIDNPS